MLHLRDGSPTPVWMMAAAIIPLTLALLAGPLAAQSADAYGDAPLPVSDITPPTGWQAQESVEPPYSAGFIDQFRLINGEDAATVQVRAVNGPAGRSTDLRAFGLKLPELSGEWRAPLEAASSTVDGRLWWHVDAAHPEAGPRSVLMTRHNDAVLLVVIDGPDVDAGPWQSARVWTWDEPTPEPVNPAPHAIEPGVISPDEPQTPLWYDRDSGATRPRDSAWAGRAIRAAVGGETAHDLLSPIYIPTWQGPIGDTESLRAGLRYGFATNGSTAVDANYSEFELDLRYAPFDRLEFSLGFGIGMWDGTINAPGNGDTRDGGVSTLDLLLGIRVAVLKSGSDTPLDLTIGLAVKVPTGSRADYLGTERPDAGYSIDMQLPLGIFTLLAQFNGVAVGRASELRLPGTTLITLGIGGGLTFDEVFSASVTFDMVFIDGARPVFSLGVGARTAPLIDDMLYPELSLGIGLSDSAADFTVRFGLMMLFG